MAVDWGLAVRFYIAEKGKMKFGMSQINNFN